MKRKRYVFRMITDDYNVVRAFDTVFDRLSPSKWRKVIFDPEERMWVICYSTMYWTIFGRWLTRWFLIRAVNNELKG
jgi:hypothetical protein